MQILGKHKAKAILLAASLVTASMAMPASAHHDSANLAPLAAFIAFGALLHHGRQHSHRYEYHYRQHRHYHSPRRHSHSHGGYQRYDKRRHWKHH